MTDSNPLPLDDELEKEIAAALGSDSLLGVGRPGTSIPTGDVPPDVVPEPGKFADATVSGVGGEDVFVEFGPRAQGVVPADQFGAPPLVGETVRVYVERHDAKEGIYICALKRTLQAAAGWGSVEPGAVVMATARAANSGGLAVQVGHIEGFLPASHVALGHVEDLETIVGETFPVEVIEADPDRRRLVVSRRAVLARERDQLAASTIETLHSGDVVTGTVTRIEKFGAFVDLGGVEGLLHVSQMAWKRVENPEDIVKTGDVLKVQVLEIDIARSRIGLGLKQMQEDPWIAFTHRSPEGTVLEGTVTKLAQFGAFVEVADGVEGLAHISQLAPHPIGSPKEIVKPGDVIAVRVATIDPERHRIGLSLLTERGDRLTDDVADDATIQERLGRQDDGPVEPTLGDLLKRAMEQGGR